ncbi:hypothetical protein [Oceanospirillum sp.]|uniref:hypothetical protein n=1 Tax=Oceanospirillum sp. TaxID=2021254 RepID=UPI003A905AD6
MDRDIDRKDSKQKGYSEYLLCQRCESLFSSWERELRNFFACVQKRKGNTKISIETQCDLGKRKLHKISGLNYRFVKLGLLSILWRLSLSKVEHFLDYDLGPVHQEKVRRILDNSEYLLENEYWTAITVGTMEHDAHLGFQSFHKKKRILGQRFQLYTICATTIYIRVASNSDKLPDGLKNFGLREDGTVLVLETDLADSIVKNKSTLDRLNRPDVVKMFGDVYKYFKK